MRGGWICVGLLIALAGCASPEAPPVPLDETAAPAWVLWDRRALPGGAGGLLVHDGALWQIRLSGRKRTRLLRLDPETLEIVETRFPPAGDWMGFTTDGASWWLSDSVSGDVLVCTPALEVQRTVSVLGVVEVPVGLAWDGNLLWIADAGEACVAAWDPVRRDVVRRFLLPGRRVTALAWDGALLWVGDLSHREMLGIDAATGAAVTTLPLPELPSSATFDGTTLWIATMEGSLLRYRRP